MTQFGSAASVQAVDSVFVQNPQLRKDFRYWRIRILYTTIIGYATFYLVRQNFAMAMPVLSDLYGYTKTDLGKILSVWAIVYGTGKFVNGYISDRANARYFITIGLMGSTATCFLMAFGTTLQYFLVIWFLNAWFQSMAWPPVVRLLTHWFCPTELGTKWSMWATSHQIGGAGIVLLAGYLLQNYSWQSAFYIPAILASFIGIFLFDRLRDTPQSLGFPSVEEYKGILSPSANHEDENLTHKELIHRVLANKLLWYVCLGNMFLYVVRLGLFNWAPTMLKELKGAEMLTSGWQLFGFEIAGIIGGLSAGWMSDKLFGGRRGPVATLYTCALFFSLLYFWYIPAGNHGLDAAAMFAVGFLVFGPQVLAGIASADFATKKAAGLASGLVGTFGYIGTSISGYGVGYIADRWGWDGGILFFLTSAVCGSVFFALTWSHRAKVLDQHHANADTA